MTNSRERFNSSVAETIGDILGVDRDSIKRTLTNPIKLSNVADTVGHMPADISDGVTSMLKAPLCVTRHILNATENAAKGHHAFALNELGRGTRALLLSQLAPVINVGKRFTSSVRDNQ